MPQPTDLHKSYKIAVLALQDEQTAEEYFYALNMHAAEINAEMLEQPEELSGIALSTNQGDDMDHDVIDAMIYALKRARELT